MMNSKDLRVIKFEENYEHNGTAVLETPLRADAFKIDDELNIELIEKNFREIMNILGLDLSDDSLKDTPRRVAKCMLRNFLAD